MAAKLNWIDTVFFGVRRVLSNAVELEERNAVHFAPPLVATDNPADKRIDVTVPPAGPQSPGTLPATTGDDKVLVAPGNAPEWAKVTDVNVDASAAIAGAKVAADFGAQDIVTTKSLRIGESAGSGAGAAADAGSLRMARGGVVAVRNANDTGDVTVIGSNGAGTIEIGGELAGPGTRPPAVTLDATNVVALTVGGQGLRLGAGRVEATMPLLVRNVPTPAPEPTGAVQWGANGALNAMGSEGDTHTLCPRGVPGFSDVIEEREVTIGPGDTDDLWTIVPGTNDQEMHVEVFALAREESGDDAAAVERRSTFKVRNGQLTPVGDTPPITHVDDNTWNLTIIGAGGSVRVRAFADAVNKTTFTASVRVRRRQ